MTPSEIRAELLQQHAELRAMIDETRLLAEDTRGAAPMREAIRASIVHLADKLRSHNVREEDLLREIVPTVDAWGPTRAAIMTEEHAHEHNHLCTALLGIACTADWFEGAAISALLELILRHMDREEAAFLGEDVLRDDVVVVNQSAD